MKYRDRYTQFDENATERRIMQFQGFYSSLDDEERNCLDAKIARWVMVIKRRSPNVQFTTSNARELFMALLEFDGIVSG